MGRVKVRSGGISDDSGFAQVGEVHGVAKATFTVPGERPGEPDLTGLIEVRNGRPMLTELTVKARAGGREIRLSDCARAFSGTVSPELIERAWGKLAWIPEDAGDGRMTGVLGGRDQQQRQQIRDEIDRSRNRAEGVPRAELERVAAVYLEHAAHPDGKPVEAVQRDLGYRTRSTTSRRIKAAADLGLLPPTTPGRPRTAAAADATTAAVPPGRKQRS